jgi:hypothetical protein
LRSRNSGKGGTKLDTVLVKHGLPEKDWSKMVCQLQEFIFFENAFPSLEEQNAFVDQLVQAGPYVKPADDLIAKVYLKFAYQWLFIQIFNINIPYLVQ